MHSFSHLKTPAAPIVYQTSDDLSLAVSCIIDAFELTCDHEMATEIALRRAAELAGDAKTAGLIAVLGKIMERSYRTEH
jgi:hypothetical protein